MSVDGNNVYLTADRMEVPKAAQLHPPATENEETGCCSVGYDTVIRSSGRSFCARNKNQRLE